MRRRRVALGERARIPFALVGVLLVVTSALFAAAVQPPARPAEPAVDVAMERTAADARATLRRAVAAAAVAAASDPVVTPANTSYGRLLDDDRAFSDALEMRIYLRARERFASVGRTHRGVATTASLPATPTPDALARAMERVSVEAAGPNGTRLDVTVRNVTQTARRGGRTVGRRNVSYTVRVHSPVLAVHERVDTFQARLDAGLDEPGLTRLVTGRLYALAWARGYAQYGGAPIENVVANRHVGLLANGAVLELQRSVFDRSDPDGRRSHARAVGATGVRDVLRTVDAGRFAAANDLLRERLRSAATPTERNGIRQPVGARTGVPGPNETISVNVGKTADHAFAPYARDARARNPLVPFGTGSSTDPVGSTAFAEAGRLNETIQSVFTATVRTLGDAERVEGGRPPRPHRPDGPGEWELVDDTVRTRVASVDGTAAGPAVTTPAGYHRFHDYHRLVTLTHERVRTWRHDGWTNTTRTTSRERRRVTVAVVGRHAATPFAPDRPIDVVHEPAGPFGGPNLADVLGRVNESVVRARGGPDGLAGTAARGTLDTGPTTLRGAWPADLRAWVYRDLVDLRRTVRAVSVEVRRGRVGTFQANPAARLVDRLRDRREALLDAPSTYEHVAHKARVALRGEYLDRVIRLLEARAERHEQRERELAGALAGTAGGSLSRLRATLGARRVHATGDDADGLELAVDGAPPYLTLAGVEHDQVSAVEPGTTVYPLVARNVNVAAVPYDDATDTVLNGLGEALAGDPRTRLETAARALGSVDSAASATDNETLAADRSTLRAAVSASVDTVRSGASATLRSHGVADASVRRAVVATAFDRWATPRARALAVSNLSVVEAVVDATVAHPATDLSAMERDRLRLDLRDRVTRALDTGRVQVDGGLVATATSRAKAAVGDRVRREMSAAARRRLDRSVTRMPAGIPVMPPVSPWYATTNVWWVTVAGRYERFAVEAPRRTPAAADASLSYVRDGANVTLDVDGDGTGELLGRADRVAFRVHTGVVVVVPSGGSGVGDLDGDMDERSPGWPRPGPDGRDPSGPGDRGNATAAGPADDESAGSP